MWICHLYLGKLFTIIFVFNKNILNYSLQLGIKIWLRFICKRINIKNLILVKGEGINGKINKLYLEASNLIFENLHINKIILQANDFYINFNLKEYNLFSDDIFVDCFLMINSSNLEKMLFKEKWKDIRTHFENEFTERKIILKVYIKNNLIYFNYKKNNLDLKKKVTLKLKGNFLFFEDVKNKKKVSLPLDKNINLKSCLIKNELININFSSKVSFET